MPTNHVTQQIEAYLDNRLSAHDRRRVEEHIAQCPTCANRLFEARRLADELGIVMKKKLGQPLPPPALRYRLQQQLEAEPSIRRFQFLWAASGRVLNALGSFAAMSVLLLAAYFVIRGQLPGVTTQSHLSPNNVEETPLATTPEPVIETDVVRSSTPVTSLGDRLSLPRNLETSDEAVEVRPQPNVPSTEQISPFDKREVEANLTWPGKENEDQASTPNLPDGTIAFSFFNSGAAFYEIHLVDPDGQNRRRFPVDGVSEPALRRSENGDYQIAYRTWGEPTSPRALTSNDIDNNQPDALTHFWEDAHPDWSPTENRLIFASQRESDRRWRLYTIWGDGSEEVDLRREGRSPTFAPDGFRFAFVGCEEPLNKIGCGLLVGDLENIEHEADLIFENAFVESPDWSPTGEQIAYMADPTGNWDLYVMNSNGRNIRQLTDDPAIDGLPTWSPDGQWLAFLSNRSGKWAVWALHVASGHTQLVVDFNEGDFMSPNGRAPYQGRDWQDEQLSWVE